MTEHEFTLIDRITKIKSINEQYDLENNAYISFSGGKDSTVLHYLVDEALPNNKIPRVFINTGIEYKAIMRFVRSLAEKDNRFVILTVGKNIPKTLASVGYPFKSKEHAHKVSVYQRSGLTKTVLDYIGKGSKNNFLCPKKMLYNFTQEFTLKVSDQCCYEFKKKPSAQFEQQTGRYIGLTGMMKTEGGYRTRLNCIVTDSKTGKIHRFHPLSIVTEEWERWYIANRSIKLCDLYYPPFNFERTGCVCCPFSQTLQAQLDTLSVVAPDEKKRAEYIWKPVYDEYRRIGYRLRKELEQPSLFDF